MAPAPPPCARRPVAPHAAMRVFKADLRTTPDAMGPTAAVATDDAAAAAARPAPRGAACVAHAHGSVWTAGRDCLAATCMEAPRTCVRLAP
eukprot:361194-Chlamydomonas_euryale.AAC.3